MAEDLGSQIIGKQIWQVRTELLNQGWQIVMPPSATIQEEGSVSDASAAQLRASGLPEVWSCTGTGLNYCWLKYERKSQCLAIQTQGERDPKVHRFVSDCKEGIPK
jgi:hypothetical protein